MHAPSMTNESAVTVLSNVLRIEVSCHDPLTGLHTEGAIREWSAGMVARGLTSAKKQGVPFSVSREE
jgi:hypothetical protein